MPCLNLMIFLQDNVLTSAQRLMATYIITDLYPPNAFPSESKSAPSKNIKEENAENPFLSFFLDSLKYNPDPTEQQFLASRLTQPNHVRSQKNSKHFFVNFI